MDPILSMHLFANMIRVGSQYTRRWIHQTGYVIHKYEIGYEKF